MAVAPATGCGAPPALLRGLHGSTRAVPPASGRTGEGPACGSAPPSPGARSWGASSVGLALAVWAGLWQAARRRPRRGGAVACEAYKFKNPPPQRRYAKRKQSIDPEIKHVDQPHRSFFFSQCPEENPKVPEFAVFGRSNVGKSSLINFLTGRKLLSTVSKRPGHTKLIHHFLVDQAWYMVDLPGIGYAEGKYKKRKAMDRLVTAYIRHRQTLVQVLYLCDASLPPQDIDLHGIKWLTDAGVDITIVFTKSDKDRRFGALEGPQEEMAKALFDMEESPWRLGQRELPEMFLTSSEVKTGREALLKHIAGIRERCRPRRAAGASEDKQGKLLNAREPPPGIR